MKYFDGSSTNTTSYTYNNGNQLTQRSVGGHTVYYDYDDNGNMEVEYVYDPNYDSRRIFSWNADNRMTVAENIVDDTVAEYTYDAMGRRIMRWDPYENIKTMYYYDGLTVIAEKQKVGSGSWDWQRIFTVGPGVIGNIFRISTKSGGNWVDAYYHYDAIGNVALRTNSGGSVVESIDQEAYGNVKIGAQSGYHLTTKEYDSIPELYYFWARWYDPEIRRFISQSTFPSYIEHQYNYVKNKPLKYIDPSGLQYLDGYLCDPSTGWCNLNIPDDYPRPGESYWDCVDRCYSDSMFGCPHTANAIGFVSTFVGFEYPLAGIPAGVCAFAYILCMIDCSH